MGERGVLGAIGDAIADIRAKLIDEGWFGRHGPTPGGGLPEPTNLGWERPATALRSADEIVARPSFDEAWATRERPAERDQPDHGMDLDR